MKVEVFDEKEQTLDIFKSSKMGLKNFLEMMKITKELL